MPVSDLGILRCPTTGGRLDHGTNGELISEDGSFSYPLIAGVPVLINERRSPARIADYVRPPNQPRSGGLRKLIDAVDGILPSLSHNVGSRANYRRLAELLSNKKHARVLVVGGAIAGAGFDALLAAPNIECVDTDIAWGPRTAIICDAHDLPFQDASFDAVVCQAVLEHVLDPSRVVDEIHRVLAAEGLVYSEVPFMYPVHGAPYDFTRFTPLGHRRLYRHFDEIEWGMQSGPATGLGLSLTYFLRSLARTQTGGAMAMRMGRLLFFWLKHVDRWLLKRPTAIEAPAGTFFLGRRRTKPIADERIIASYPGPGTRQQVTNLPLS
jgi:SAM-dependent methyltransferase